MNEAGRRTNGGRSDESTDGGNEGVTNDQKVERREATGVIEEMDVEVR